MDFKILLLFSWCIVTDFTYGQTDGQADLVCRIRFDRVGDSKNRRIYLSCSIAPDEDYGIPCTSSKGIVVTNIHFLKHTECDLPDHQYGYKIKETEDRFTWKAVGAACNGLSLCHKPEVTLIYRCGENRFPVQSFDVEFSCKPVVPDENRVWDMAEDFTRGFTTSNNEYYLVLNATKQSGPTHRRCQISGDNTEIKVKLLYGDLGSGESCGRIHVYNNLQRDPLLNKDCNSLHTSPTDLFETTQGNNDTTMDMQMLTGFLWLEVTGTQSFTIKCQDRDKILPTTTRPRTDRTNSTGGTSTTDDGKGVSNISSAGGGGGDDDNDNFKLIIIIVIAAVFVIVVIIIITVAVYRWKRKARGRDLEKSEAVCRNVDDTETQDHSSNALLPKAQGSHGGKSTPTQTTANNVDLGEYMEIPDTTFSTPEKSPQKSNPKTKKARNPAADEMYSEYSTATEPQNSGRPADPSSISSSSKPNMGEAMMSPQSDEIPATYSVVDKKKATLIQSVLPEGVYNVTNLTTAQPVTATATYQTLDSVTGVYAHLKRPGDEQQVIDNIYDG